MSPNRCVRSFITQFSRTIVIPTHITSVEELRSFIAFNEGCSTDSFSICSEGKPINSDCALLPQWMSFTATMRLEGGKGGFGSMLRAIGAQIEKTTNKEACRDLSGRRLRDIKKEERLKEQLERRAERERELAQQRKKKYESLKQEPKHMFNDDTFHKQQEEISNELFSSLEKGLKEVGSVKGTTSGGPSSSGSGSDTNDSSVQTGTKRKAKDSSKPVKKGRFFDDLDDSSDDSD